MTIMRVKGFQIFTDRHGKIRCYHRATREAVDLTEAPIGSAAFFSECARITALTAVSGPPKPGTLGALITEYRSSQSFSDLAARTQTDYQRCLDYLRPITDTALSRFDRALVVRIRDKAAGKHGRRFGNYVKAVLSIIFAWGIERGYLKSNPAEKVKNIRRLRGTPEANRTWTDDEREAVLINAPEHMRPAIALMMFTGLGPKDALRLPRTCYNAGEIATHRSKTKEPVFWQAPEVLQEILTAAPSHNAITLCANSNGRPWTESGFRASWRKLRIKLEYRGLIGSGLTLYGLRHTLAVILREAEADERTIADALGQKTIEMARHYAQGADLKRKMRGVAARFDREVNRRRTKVVKPTS
jgi:site-specific recombinase XerC